MNLRFVVPGIPPSMNARMNHYARADSNSQFRRDAKLAGVDALNRSAKWPDETGLKVKLAFTFVFGLTRRHDLDNLIASVKPVVDGIVDARIIEDDSTEHVVAISATARVRRVDDPRGEFVIVDVETVE